MFQVLFVNTGVLFEGAFSQLVTLNKSALFTMVFYLRAKTTCILVKIGECFPDLFEIPRYLEKIEYVRQI